VTTDDLLDYCMTVCRAVTLPILIQDFNPGGPTIDGSFCARLLDSCPNFQYVKLEEPLMGTKVTSIRNATADQVAVLEGWGGMYLLDLVPFGIRGSMPGLGPADLLARVWRLSQQGQVAAALDVFERVLPQLVFGLQNLELFLHLEKRLLVDRGVLPNAVVRRATYTPAPEVLEYGCLLNRRVLATLAYLGLAQYPANGK
jgi:4-hydroxy-tetrahydrodipicolinate synthase